MNTGHGQAIAIPLDEQVRKLRAELNKAEATAWEQGSRLENMALRIRQLDADNTDFRAELVLWREKALEAITRGVVDRVETKARARQLERRHLEAERSWAELYAAVYGFLNEYAKQGGATPDPLAESVETLMKLVHYRVRATNGLDIGAMTAPPDGEVQA